VIRPVTRHFTPGFTRGPVWGHTLCALVNYLRVPTGLASMSRGTKQSVSWLLVRLSIAAHDPIDRRPTAKCRDFTATLADEWAYAHLYRSDAERCDQFPIWLHTYNHNRGHTALGGLPPASRVPNLPGQYSSSSASRWSRRAGSRCRWSSSRRWDHRRRSCQRTTLRWWG